MSTRRRIAAIAAMGCLAATLAACSNQESEILGGGKSSLSPSEVIDDRILAPTPDTSDLGDVVDPANKGEVGDMPAAIEPSGVDLDGSTIAGFSNEQLKDAASWAAAFTRTRFTRSGLWVTGNDQANPTSPVTYYVFVSQMTPEAQSEIAPLLLGEAEVQENLDTLSKLVPLPPDIDGTWMVPAVGNFTFGQPVFSSGDAGEKSINIALPYAAYAVYGEKDRGRYWAIEIRDKAAYTLVFTREGWKLADWESSVAYGEPEALRGAPEDRFFAEIPEQLAGER